MDFYQNIFLRVVEKTYNVGEMLSHNIHLYKLFSSIIFGPRVIYRILFRVIESCV